MLRFLGLAMLAENARSNFVLPPVLERNLSDSEPLLVSSGLTFEVVSGDIVLEACVAEAITAAVGAVSSRIVASLSSTEGVGLLVVRYSGPSTGSIIPHSGVDESYKIVWNPESIEVVGNSISGVVYGLTTLSQMLFERGSLPSSSGAINDRPTYRHRGLLVDTGRRFWPLWFLKQTLDGMAAAKMNVLHLHLSDNCRFAVESKSHPEIHPEDGRFLTQGELADLIHYAALRGIRVIPEIDLPGHARGMRNAAGVTWADPETRVQMSSSYETRAFIKDILNEFADLFSDEYFHIGADETHNAPAELIEFAIAVLRAKGKRVIGWEEAHFTSNAGSPETLTIQLWKDNKLYKDIREGGFETIYSLYTKLYMDLRPRVNDMWLDISAKTGYEGLIGGETAMWTDVYCPLADCYKTRKPPTVAGHMYPESADELFAASINRLMWPKTMVAASSFWRYDSSTDIEAMIDLNFFKRYYARYFNIQGCVDSETVRCSELEHESPQEGFSLAFADTPIPASAFQPEVSAREASIGLYLSHYADWGSQDAGLITKFGTGGPYPDGDVYCYYIDAMYSTTAFGASTEGIEAFLLQYREVSDQRDNTIWFVYDDAGKKDPVLFRHLVRRFKGFLNRLELIGLRAAVGKLGIMLSTEEANPKAFQQVVFEELNVVRDANTRFGVKMYSKDVKTLEFGLKVADHVLISAGGKSVEAVMEKVEIALSHKALTKGYTARVSFLIGKDIFESATEVMGLIQARIPVKAREVFKPRGLVVTGWRE